jgi:ABC-type sugar transport system permease subunit
MFALLAILPTLAIFAYVRIYPIGDTLRLSLHKWDILSKNKPFIGFANFEELTGDPLFREALLNTTIIAFGVLLITIPLALVLAALTAPARALPVFTRRQSSFHKSCRSCRPPWRGSGSSMPASAL